MSHHTFIIDDQQARVRALGGRHGSRAHFGRSIVAVAIDLLDIENQ